MVFNNKEVNNILNNEEVRLSGSNVLVNMQVRWWGEEMSDDEFKRWTFDEVLAKLNKG